MRYCCENCFANLHIKEFIIREGENGNCDYCGQKNTHIISNKRIGLYFRECFDKAYETIDTGSGAYYDSEDKDYYGPHGELADRFSVMDILEKEGVFYDISNVKIIDDIILESGPSVREINQGAFDQCANIYDECYVLKNDLEGVYGTRAYHTWEHFKFNVKHYNRFFDVDGYLTGIDFRKELLDRIQPLIMEYESTVDVNTKFYRARKISPPLNFDTLIINKEMSPAPPKYTQINRMSPAGISYLYVSSTKETACSECRYNDCEVVIAEYCVKRELQIIDFSKEVCFSNTSIFSEEYEHDSQWLNNFLSLFSKEISKPINDNSNNAIRSYEYVATQLIAEYIRSLGYDGIGFSSSVDEGKSYCFFCGPDLNFCKGDYGIIDDIEYYQTIPSFLEYFNINLIELFNVSRTLKLCTMNKTRENELKE